MFEKIILKVSALDFQLSYARKEWSREKAAWRPVIFLNFVRNVNVVLSHLSSEMFDIPYDAYNAQEQEDSNTPRPPRTLNRIKFTDKHQQLRENLAPLANIQRLLEDKLGSASFELQSTSVNTAAPFDQDTYSSSSSSQYRGLHEFSIHSSNGWKSALDRLRSFGHSGTSRGPAEGSGEIESPSSLTPSKNDNPDEEIAVELAKCRRDIKALWEDDIVAEVLSRRKVRLEDAPGL